jgi:hypothetical protein
VDYLEKNSGYGTISLLPLVLLFLLEVKLFNRKLLVFCVVILHPFNLHFIISLNNKYCWLDRANAQLILGWRNLIECV